MSFGMLRSLIMRAYVPASASAKALYAFIRDVFAEFKRDHGTLFAAAISFFGLVSFIPLMLLSVGVFGYVIGSHDVAFDAVIASTHEFLPISTNEIETYLRGLSNQSSVLSGLGLLGLLWSGTQVFVILQQVMDVALGVKEGVGFLRGRGVAVIIAAFAGILFTLSIALTSLLTAASRYRLAGFDPAGLRTVWDSIGVLLPILMSTLAFTLIYKYLPTRSIGTLGPVVGGATAGLLFEIAKFIFKLYVINFPSFHIVYGSLGSVVLLIVWIYYASVIAVLGAEVASAFVRHTNKYRGTAKPQTDATGWLGD